MAEKHTERTGTKGILKLHCKSCGDTFGAFLKEPKTEYTCRCGNKIPLDWLGRFEFDCPECGKHTFGQTNIEDATLEFKCICGADHSLEWNSKSKAYTL
ncbi:MAG: hypothetical protein ACI4JC_01175 [Faecalibacterium sp.]